MLVPLVVLASAIAMIAFEATRPGRAWPQVAGWWRRAAILNGVQAAMVFVGGVAWERWMQGIRPPWAPTALGPTAGAAIGYVAITFIYYWWHRWRHEIPGLWRWVHQVHHSPQRIEVIASFYKHPIEILVNSILSSAILFLLVGLDPLTASYAVLLTGVAELFYHWNVKTPYWMGFFIQRPESHCVHHQEGLHSYNYSDLPLWDMLFGTFHNPRGFAKRCGFGAEREACLGDMLLGKDISTPREAGEGS